MQATSDEIHSLPLQRGEGRWLHAGRGLHLVVQHGSVVCRGAPQSAEDGGHSGLQRLDAGDAGRLRGWTWLQAERSSRLLLVQPAGGAPRWRQAAQALLKTLHRLRRAAAAGRDPALHATTR